MVGLAIGITGGVLGRNRLDYYRDISDASDGNSTEELDRAIRLTSIGAWWMFGAGLGLLINHLFNLPLRLLNWHTLAGKHKFWIGVVSSYAVWYVMTLLDQPVLS